MSSCGLLVKASSCVSRFKPFSRISRVVKEAFVHDLCLIALSIRTGYLVDNVNTPGHLARESYSILLDELRELSDTFNDVLHLFEPSSNQSFIVNKTLLINKLQVLLRQHTSSTYPSFVYLPERDEPHQLDTIPLPLLLLLQTILKDLTDPDPMGLPTTLQLPTDLPSTLCIPLAAIILDYPVAYVPAGDQVSFLGGVPLVLFRCWVNGYPPTSAEKNHLLLQFSCPLSLTNDSSTPTGIGQVTSHLKSTFEPRISKSLSGVAFQIDYEYVTLDRVAL